MQAEIILQSISSTSFRGNAWNEWINEWAEDRAPFRGAFIKCLVMVMAASSTPRAALTIIKICCALMIRMLQGLSLWLEYGWALSRLAGQLGVHLTLMQRQTVVSMCGCHLSRSRCWGVSSKGFPRAGLWPAYKLSLNFFANSLTLIVRLGIVCVVVVASYPLVGIKWFSRMHLSAAHFLLYRLRAAKYCAVSCSYF